MRTQMMEKTRMKTFKDIVEGGQGSPAADYVAPKDKDNEVLGGPDGYAYQSKGEQDFADQHVELSKQRGVDMGYPVHPDNKVIFNGQMQPAEAKEGAKVNNGETKVLKTYKDFVSSMKSAGDHKGHGYKDTNTSRPAAPKVTINQTPARKADQRESFNIDVAIEEAFKTDQEIELETGDKVTITKKIADNINKTIKQISGENADRMKDEMLKSRKDFDRVTKFAQVAVGEV